MGRVAERFRRRAAYKEFLSAAKEAIAYSKWLVSPEDGRGQWLGSCDFPPDFSYWMRRLRHHWNYWQELCEEHRKKTINRFLILYHRHREREAWAQVVNESLSRMSKEEMEAVITRAMKAFIQ